MPTDAVPAAPASTTAGTEPIVRVVHDAVWRRNIVWAQMLGLCPLLAVSGTVVNAVGLALASLFVLTSSNVSVALIARTIPNHLRLPAFMLVIAGFTTAAMLVMQAYAFELYLRIALFVQIIVTNCIILARAEQFARHSSPMRACVDGLATGIGFGTALIMLGVLREIIGHGTLFANMDMLFGIGAAAWQIDVSATPPLLIASLPPGAFVAAGLLIALRNALAGETKRP
jgi:Na+-translocating ferredoxin:NAD+ oxidoreductase subunit E